MSAPQSAKTRGSIRDQKTEDNKERTNMKTMKTSGTGLSAMEGAIKNENIENLRSLLS